MRLDEGVALDVVMIRLGSAAVRAAMKLWLGDAKVAADVGSSAVDMLADRLTSTRERRKLRRMVENFEEVVGDRLEPIIEREFRNLADNERLAATEAVAETFERASLVDADLFAADLDAGRLDRTVRARVPNMTNDLSQDATALYNLLLRESCSYVIEITRGLPTFTAHALTELLRRDDEILAGVREVLARLPPRDRAAGFGYDYRQLVARTLDEVELFGITASDASTRYPLSVAYISLYAVGGLTEAHSTSRRVEELLAGPRRVFIRGEAGLGKTTLLRWIAVRSARADFPAPLTDWNGTVPFLVPLRRYADRDLPTPEQFLGEAGRHIAAGMPKNWVHKQLREGKAVLLVDGVDELAAERRTEVQAWLRNLIGQFPHARYVVTSRPSGVPRTWLSTVESTVVDIQPMTPTDVQVFVSRWYQAMRVQCVDDEMKAELDEYQEDLLEQLRVHGHLRRLASYPLLCALLCALHRNHKAALPSNRMDLYEVALEMLLERRDAQRRLPAPRDMQGKVKLILLGDFAYWLIRNELSDRTRPCARADQPPAEVHAAGHHQRHPGVPPPAGTQRPAAGVGRGTRRLHPPQLPGVPGSTQRRGLRRHRQPHRACPPRPVAGRRRNGRRPHFRPPTG